MENRMENRFEYNGKHWVWTRTDGSQIVLTGADVQDLNQLSHIAARLGT